MNWRGEVFYSADSIEKLTNEDEAVRVLTGSKRVFIMTVRDTFSTLDSAMRKATGKHLHLLPGSNIRYVIASNQIDPGMAEQNPLTENVLASPPTIAHPLRAEFADGVAFLGYDVTPTNPHTGGDLTLTLYFHCLKAIEKNWQVFVHLDGHGREFERIIGDHFPLQGFYPTNRWLPGDIIRDQINLSIPFDYSAERYTVYVGFFMGDQRQAVLAGFPQDGANRVRAGTLDVR